MPFKSVLFTGITRVPSFLKTMDVPQAVNEQGISTFSAFLLPITSIKMMCR